MKLGVIGNTESIEYFKGLLKSIPVVKLANSFNVQENNLNEENDDYNLKLYRSFLNSVDTIIIARSTEQQFPYAMKAIRETKHVYIQEPYLLSLKSLNSLICAANEADSTLKLQEKARFHPLVKEIISGDKVTGILHIDHRKKYTDSANITMHQITKDLAFDIETCIILAASDIKKIHTNALPNVGNGIPEMITARLDFDNGTKADINYNTCSKHNYHRGIMYKLNETTEFDFKKNYYHQVNTLLFNTQSLKVKEALHDTLYYDLKYFLDIIEYKEKSLMAAHNSYMPLHIIEKVLREIYSC